jgi:hypothetical protein
MTIAEAPPPPLQMDAQPIAPGPCAQHTRVQVSCDVRTKRFAEQLK